MDCVTQPPLASQCPPRALGLHSALLLQLHLQYKLQASGSRTAPAAPSTPLSPNCLTSFVGQPLSKFRFYLDFRTISLCSEPQNLAGSWSKLQNENLTWVLWFTLYMPWEILTLHTLKA